jgi:hypothetical protein
MESNERRMDFYLSQYLYEKLNWMALSGHKSKGEVIRQLIEKETATNDDSTRLDAVMLEKTNELNRIQAQINDLGLKKQEQIIAEPVKKEKYESLWEDAVNLTIRAIPNNKENVVADGNATYIRSFGFKVTTKDILNEAYKRKGLMHKIEQTIKED